MELLVVSQNGCAPCKSVKHYLKMNEVEFKEFNLTTDETVEIDSNKFTADELEVGGTPTIILFEDGEEVTRVLGFKPNELDVLISQL